MDFSHIIIMKSQHPTIILKGWKEYTNNNNPVMFCCVNSWLVFNGVGGEGRFWNIILLQSKIYSF